MPALGYIMQKQPDMLPEKTPRKGAIVVTTENRYYGHVALVEKVSKDTITVSEMNYMGFAKTSRRTIPINSRVIRGYIY